MTIKPLEGPPLVVRLSEGQSAGAGKTHSWDINHLAPKSRYLWVGLTVIDLWTVLYFA